LPNLFFNIGENLFHQLVYNSFADFYENNVMAYPTMKNEGSFFVGSIGFYFSDILRQVANDKGVTVKNILESPIAGLTLFHKKDVM